MSPAYTTPVNINSLYVIGSCLEILFESFVGLLNFPLRFVASLIQEYNVLFIFNCFLCPHLITLLLLLDIPDLITILVKKEVQPWDKGNYLIMGEIHIPHIR